MNADEMPFLQVPKWCIDCNKAYTKNGIGADVLMDCPGGLCLGCGKPALVDFANEYLSLPRHDAAGRHSVESMHSHFQLSMSVDKENDELIELINGLSVAKEAAGRVMLSMKKARQRSTDARRGQAISTSSHSGSLRFDLSLQKRVELAEAELRDLNATISSFSKADAVIELEETAQHYSLKLSEASKRLRALQSDNTRREKELERAAKQSVDHGNMEDSLRRELFGVRQRNSQLSVNIEANERALDACIKIESKLRSQIDALRGVPPQSLKARRNELVDLISAMKSEKERLTEKWNKLKLQEAQKMSYLTSLIQHQRPTVETPPIEDTREEVSVLIPKNGDRSLSIIEPTTALQSPAHHALITEPPVPDALNQEETQIAVPQRFGELEGECVSTVDYEDKENQEIVLPELPGLAHEIAFTVPENALDKSLVPEYSDQAIAPESVLPEVGSSDEALVEEINIPESELQEVESPDGALEEEITVPEIKFPVESLEGAQEEISEDFHATDEALTAAECAEVESIHICPRRLFQAAAAKEDDSHVLGVRKLSPVPPLIQVPKIFHIESRASSTDGN